MSSRVRFSSQDGQHLDFLELRKAFLCFLVAKKTRGQLIFRVDNVMDKRPLLLNQPITALDNLSWLGLIPDESPLNPNLNFAPYVQNERLDIYQRYAATLLSLGKAYKKMAAVDNPVFNSELRPVLYFKMSGFSDGFTDLLMGKVPGKRLNSNDWMIINASGFPTRDFAAIIDDHLMNITHIVFEEKQLPNASKYLSLCNALNWTIPDFIHLPDVKIGDENKNSQFVSHLQEEGYLPEAICSYLYELDVHEYEKGNFETISEIINDFEIKKILANKKVFSLETLRKINGALIKKTSDIAYATFIRPFVSPFINETYSDEYLLKLAVLYQTQISYGSELKEYLVPFLLEKPSFSPIELQIINSPTSKLAIETLKTKLQAVDASIDDIKNIIVNTQLLSGVSGKAFYLPLRLLLTRSTQGAEIDEIIKFLGKEEVLRRLSQDKD